MISTKSSSSTGGEQTAATAYQSSTSSPNPTSSSNTIPQSNVEAKAAPTAVIGPKIKFKGELIGEEDLLVQGEIEGTIDLKNHNLFVGKQGTLKANATAKTIIIEGEVEGDLHGEERIVIKESSNVSGNLTAERVALEDGAKFRGSIDMDPKPQAAKSSPANTSGGSSNSTASKSSASQGKS